MVKGMLYKTKEGGNSESLAFNSKNLYVLPLLLSTQQVKDWTLSSWKNIATPLA